MIKRIAVFASTLVLALSLTAQQSEQVHLALGPSTQVGHTAHVNGHQPNWLARLFGAKETPTQTGLRAAVNKTALVEITARHADGTVFYHVINHNLTTNAGFDLISKAVSDTAAQPAACNFIAVTNTAITPAIGDTTLSGEIAVNGLTRAQAVFAHTTGQLTYTLTKVFTATGTQASQASAVFNASSVGSMCFEATYGTVTVNNTDTLTVTWTVTLS